MRWFSILSVLAFMGAAAVAAVAHAEATAEYHLILKNHKFEPAMLKVPAGSKFRVLVTNRNATPSEFESTDFNREKIVLPDSTITVFIGPLTKGTYKFYDDFDHATAGVLVVE